MTSLPQQAAAQFILKAVLLYGVTVGSVIIGVNTLSYEFGLASAWLGFLVMFLAFSTVYFAMAQFRDEVLGGVLKISTGMLFGFGITGVASVVYVAVWEIYLHATDFEFIESYIASILESLQAQGASAAELEAARKDTATLRENYANNWYRLTLTATEIFPVGALVSLVSALILKRQPPEVVARQTNDKEA
jgi:hypothetical protein